MNYSQLWSLSREAALASRTKAAFSGSVLGANFFRYSSRWDVQSSLLLHCLLSYREHKLTFTKTLRERGICWVKCKATQKAEQDQSWTCVCAPSHERVYAHMSICWIHNDHFLILQEFSGKASKMTEQMFIKHVLFKTDGLSSTPRTHVKPRGITWASVILALPQGDGWPGQENSLEVSEQWAWNTQCYSRHKRNACFKSRKKERTNSQKIDLRPLHTMNTYNIVMLVKKIEFRPLHTTNTVYIDMLVKNRLPTSTNYEHLLYKYVGKT